MTVCELTIVSLVIAVVAETLIILSQRKQIQRLDKTVLSAINGLTEEGTID